MSLSVTVLTLPFDPATECFDLAALESMERRAEILGCTAAFHAQGGRTYCSLAVQYRLRSTTGENPRSAIPVEGRGRPPVPPADEGTYQALRAWRSKLADTEGIPPFMILTNRQLASVASLRPASLSALGSIAGIGRGRLAKYGRAILELLHGGDRREVGRDARSMEEQPRGHEPCFPDAAAVASDATASPELEERPTQSEAP